MRKIFLFVFAFFTVAGIAATNELDIARAALRDGLWNIARSHASRADGDEAKLIVLESYAQEGNWKGLLAAIDAMGYPAGEGFAYYRAAALFNDGAAASASNILAGVEFKDAKLVRPAARLRAELVRTNRKPDVALAILEKDGGDDVETKMMVASIQSERGNTAAANLIWRAMVANTNAPERARVTAAVGLCDTNALKTLAAVATSAAVRRFAALKLGVLLVQDSSTFSEGEKLIRDTVRDKPEAEGAREAYYAIAEMCLDRNAAAEAERVYADALEIWPEAAKDPVQHEGRGWALSKLGRYSDAIEEFKNAEELAADPERKAVAAVKMADALAASGHAAEATAAYQKVRTSYPNTSSAARVADVIRLRETEAKGRELYRAYKFVEARKVFDELSREDASRREQLSFYGVLCAYGAGDDEAAEKSARTLANGAADTAVRAEATLWLAKFAFNRRHWQEAEALFATFSALAPESSDAPDALVWAARSALALNDFPKVIETVARLVANYPASPARAAGMLAQGEALIELARFDEAVLVLERASLVAGASDADRLRARIMRADALFAMGADNPARYKAALDAYNAIRTGEALTPSDELSVSFKIAKTLEKLKRFDEAMDMYYTQVVLAYRTGRLAGTRYDDAARATFARAAFRLAEEYESRGRVRQAAKVLDLVRTSDVQAAGEAANRIDRMTKKGMFP